MREELENVCKEQASRIEQLNQLVMRFCLPELRLWLILHLLTIWVCVQVEKLKGDKELNSISMHGQCEEYNSMKDENKVSCWYLSLYI